MLRPFWHMALLKWEVRERKLLTVMRSDSLIGVAQRGVAQVGRGVALVQHSGLCVDTRVNVSSSRSAHVMWSSVHVLRVAPVCVGVCDVFFTMAHIMMIYMCVSCVPLHVLWCCDVVCSYCLLDVLCFHFVWRL